MVAMTAEHHQQVQQQLLAVLMYNGSAVVCKHRKENGEVARQDISKKSTLISFW